MSALAAAAAGFSPARAAGANASAATATITIFVSFIVFMTCLLVFLLPASRRLLSTERREQPRNETFHPKSGWLAGGREHHLGRDVVTVPAAERLERRQV